MSRLLSVVRVILFTWLVSCTYAELECHSESCEASSDDISLIQGLLEPDLVAKLHTNNGEITENKMPLEDGKTSKTSTTPAATKSTSTTQKAAVKGTKVKLNAAGDLPAFLAAIRFNMGLFVFFIVIFLFFQGWYPKVYAWRWKNGEPNTVPTSEEMGWFQWVSKSLRLQLLRNMKDPGDPANATAVETTTGLDEAMLLVFIEFALELMVVIGLPALILGIPVYAFAGGGFAKADRLSWAGIGNVVFNNTFETGEPMLAADEDRLGEVQWIYWTCALMVWLVVIWVQYRIFCKQRMFIDHRMHWLKHMKEPRSTTVLVQGIPADYCSNNKLKQFFEKMFGEKREEKIADAFVIKDTHRLRALIATFNADADSANQMEDADKRKTAKESLDKQLVAIKDMQREILEDKDSKYVTTSGFVTFKDRRDTERSLGIRLSEDEDTWVLETPPEASDVQYHDFEVGESTAETYQLVGYAAVAGLFFAFMPIVIGLSNVSLAIANTPFIHNLLVETGFESTAKGMLQSIGLTIMMSMLPTFLSWIFQIFFTLKAQRWAQLQIQNYYFWFLVMFVLLTTSIGTNLSATLSKVAQSPFQIFTIMAHKMPFTTHFYLNYVMLQPVTHAMNVTRYMNWLKFRTLIKICDTEERAKELSEPEDQDYYGMGSRSARMVLMLVIGLVFGTICPLMHVVVLWNFAVARVIYGYLIPFAENKKPDMGGAHWCKQLIHLQFGVLIYIIMMTGVLLERADSKIPGGFAAVSFLWWFISFRKFSRALHWETLPYAEVVEYDIKAEGNKKLEKGQAYEQLDLKWVPHETFSWLGLGKDAIGSGMNKVGDFGQQGLKKAGF